MLSRPLRHIRQNVIAYLALFIALGGTSYAALELPRNSIGPKQLRNHVIDPVKLDPKYNAAVIRAWADIDWKGTKLAVMSSSKPAPVSVKTLSGVGESINWPRGLFGRGCVASVTPKNSLPPPGTPGNGDTYVTVDFENPSDGTLIVDGFGAGGFGNGRPAPAYVVIACPTPR